MSVVSGDRGGRRVGVARPHLFHRALTARGLDDAIAGQLQRRRKDPTEVPVVLDDQHAGESRDASNRIGWHST